MVIRWNELTSETEREPRGFSSQSGGQAGVRREGKIGNGRSEERKPFPGAPCPTDGVRYGRVEMERQEYPWI